MKNFLNWFKNSTKIKRWIFLLLISMGLVCYGFTQILVLERLNLKELLSIIITFTSGFTCFVIGIICIQRRSIEIAIESTSNSNGHNNIKGLANYKRINEKGPNIVLIGGGEGLSLILKGLKSYTNNITAITTFAYSQTNENINNIELNKIKSNFISLAYDSNEIEKLMNYNLNNYESKISFNDIYFSAMEKIYGDYQKGILNSNKIFNIVGEILPVTLDKVVKCVELLDGTIIENEKEIPEILSNKATKINRAYIRPSNCKITNRSYRKNRKCRCNNIWTTVAYIQI